MFSNALRTSIQVVKARPVVPVRTIITCTRYNRYSPVESIKHQHVMVQKRTFMGPLIRYMTQFLASIGGTSIRAFFQAFQQAAAQAEGEENGQPAPQPEYTLSKGMSIPEALQIMNFKREEVNATNLSERFDQYFNANDPKTGGSFYLQSKVYRAHEALLDELDKYGYIRDESAKVTPPPASTTTTTTESSQEEAK